MVGCIGPKTISKSDGKNRYLPSGQIQLEGFAMERDATQHQRDGLIKALADRNRRLQTDKS
jgi:hypothetical protein